MIGAMATAATAIGAIAGRKERAGINPFLSAWRAPGAASLISGAVPIVIDPEAFSL